MPTNCSIRSTTSNLRTSRRSGSFSKSTKREARRLLDLYKDYADKQRFPLLADLRSRLKCSNLFNTLDARGAISVTERVGVIGRIRKLAVERSRMPGWSRGVGSGCSRLSEARMNLLLEIGAEEIPDWMLAGALEYLDGRRRRVS